LVNDKQEGLVEFNKCLEYSEYRNELRMSNIEISNVKFNDLLLKHWLSK